MLVTDATDLRVIVIDDDASARRLIRRAIESTLAPGEVVSVEVFVSPSDAIAAGRRGDEHTVVLCDHLMPGRSGVAWLPELIGAGLGPVILLTGSSEAHVAVGAIRAGASDVLDKTTAFRDPAALRGIIQAVLRRYRLDVERADLLARITETHETLEQRNVELTAHTESARRFVEHVAHEYRTPLTVIQSFAGLMRDGIGGALNERQGVFAQHIVDATSDLAGLVDDFLDITRINARAIRVDRRPERLEPLVAGVLESLESRAASRGIRLLAVPAGDLPPAFVDGRKFRRQLQNLVVNAIKYSGERTTIRVVIDAVEPWLEVTVEDQGPGIPPGEVERLFRRFQPGREFAADGTRGFGLGLSIVRDLAVLNLGTVGVSSRVGTGSRFSVRVSQAAAESVLTVYVEHLARHGHTGPVSVFEARAAGGAASIPALWDFLSRAGHPDDLILRGADPEALIVVGPSADAERWRERLIDRAASRGDLAEEPVSPLPGFAFVQREVCPYADLPLRVRPLVA